MTTFAKMDWKELDRLQKQLTEKFKSPGPRYCITSPEYAKALIGKFDRDDSINLVRLGSPLGTIEIIEKPGQRAAAWFMSNRRLVDLYLAGIITEEHLELYAKP